MKEKYSTPSIEMVILDTCDVMTPSDPFADDIIWDQITAEE